MLAAQHGSLEEGGERLVGCGARLDLGKLLLDSLEHLGLGGSGVERVGVAALGAEDLKRRLEERTMANDGDAKRDESIHTFTISKAARDVTRVRA